ncbi:MAG: hypothetical protein KGJ13_08090 [Patescibacteria group bacterium]|nr:hypothetical protein [Patescibacteria group bacterium]
MILWPYATTIITAIITAIGGYLVAKVQVSASVRATESQRSTRATQLIDESYRQLVSDLRAEIQRGHEECDRRIDLIQRELTEVRRDLSEAERLIEQLQKDRGTNGAK